MVMVSQTLAETCATTVMETLPFVMRCVGNEMHQTVKSDISVPQFMALMTIRDNPGITVSQLSDKLSSTLSATSKLLDGLLERLLVQREINPADRRRAVLSLTDQGKTYAHEIDTRVKSYFLAKLETAPAHQLLVIQQGMQALRAIFQLSPSSVTDTQSPCPGAPGHREHEIA